MIASKSGRQAGHLARHLRDRLRVDLVRGRRQARVHEQPFAGQDLVHARPPTEKTSLRRSRASPFACSGDMYAILPLSVPCSACARRRLRDPEVGELDLARRTTSARSTATRRGGSSLSGLPSKSRFECAYASADRSRARCRSRLSARTACRALRLAEQRAQVAARQVLHDDEVLAVVADDIEGLDDVRVVRASRTASLRAVTAR